MITPRMNPRTIILLFTFAALTAASGYVFLNKAAAAGFSGKIFTTTFDGHDEHNFLSKDAAYLSGGPVNGVADGLPDGIYYFQVTGPSGNDLLSTDMAVCRQLIVFSGRIVGAEGGACQHATGIPDSENGATPIKLMPFNNTTNPGGNYKAWLIRKTNDTTVAADGRHINFKNSDAKSEIFKVTNVGCPDCSPNSLLSGRKFYDANANATLDPGEDPVAGVQILIITGETQTIVTTSASGVWSTTVPTDTEYMVFELLPFTGPDGEPGSFWNQTAPVADSEGLKRYIGTASADQTNLNFGNICYVPDAGGVPVASATPCPVSDLPPPQPTPTPSPTPCTEDCGPTAVLGGRKFYDANANASLDVGEVPVEGVQVLVILTTGDGTTVTTAITDASGNWTLTVPVGAQYIIGEDQPFADPVLEPGAFWEQTAPLPNGEGFRGYSGTVTADQNGFDFGDICYKEDAGGNPIVSATPCTVWYPFFPPPPTPTPTPDNQ